MAELSHGMSIGQIELLGRRLQNSHAAGTRQLASELDGLVRSTASAWVGADADRFRSWWPSKRSKLIALAGELEEYGRAALANAAEQRQASEGGSGSVAPSPLIGSRTTLDPEPTPRGEVIEAFWATGDGRRAEFDEIEIRQLDNGNWVVVLPGITDGLEESLKRMPNEVIAGRNPFDQFIDGDKPNTARRMEYAMLEVEDGTATYSNPYARRVEEAMIAAGVPQNANVMLIGHSFGAMTAMELAGDPGFNNSGSHGGYHVNVTHVLAAGADNSWRFGELPPDTKALVLNNRYDAAFRAEDPLMPDMSPRNSGQLNIEFFGDLDGAGHAVSNYVDFLRDATDRSDLAAWLDDAGTRYGGPGERFAAKVPDIR